MSHYPTTAELAAFRRTVMVGSHPHGPVPAGTMLDWMATTPVLPHERERGIGNRTYRTRMPLTADMGEICAAYARREAAAMRHAAFEMLPDTASTEQAIETFAPTR